MSNEYVIMHELASTLTLEDAVRNRNIYGGRIAKLVFIDDEAKREDTVHVQIPVIVYPPNEYGANSWCIASQNETFDYMLEAYLPAPQPKTIQAKVTKNE